MLPLLHRIADAPREKLLWGLIGVLVVAQIIAFWMLCAWQVRKAEVRHVALQVEKMAMADCMRFIPRATATSCAVRIAAQSAPPATAALTAGDKQDTNAQAALTTMSSVTPVSINFR